MSFNLFPHCRLFSVQGRREESIADQGRCITSPPRLWTEVAALYAPPVSDVFSGGLAFSYFPTQDGYGMVTFSGANGAT